MVFDLDQNNTYYYTAQRGNWHFDSVFRTSPDTTVDL